MNMPAPTHNTIFKISVLADNALLLEGRPITIDELAQALDAAPKEGAAVWYYRENAAGEAPPIAAQVMKQIVDRRLPLKLSSKPDFSDSIGPDSVFAGVRERAAQRMFVIVRRDLRSVTLPAMPRESVAQNAIAAVERMLPSTAPRNVAVIADTSWAMAERPDIKEAGRAIPFFGILLGLVSIGHAVWVFDTSGALLAAGCRDANVLVVDSGRVQALPANWQQAARQVMRSPQIMLFDRAANQFRAVKSPES